MAIQHTTPIALTIAGSDSCAGAGIQADLKTFAALGVYGTSAITALTAQNTCTVRDVFKVPAEFVETQIQTVLADIKVDAIKIGMLANRAIANIVAQTLASVPHIPVVLDPVMISTSGSSLLDTEAVLTLVQQLLPKALIITPNIAEAAALLGRPTAKNEADMCQQAEQLLELGANTVLIKGGHNLGPQANDIFHDGKNLHILKAARIDTKNTHGTGCTLASAITAGLAKGLTPLDACSEAKQYLHRALAHANELHVGCGHGPVHHFFSQKTPEGTHE